MGTILIVDAGEELRRLALSCESPDEVVFVQNFSKSSLVKPLSEFALALVDRTNADVSQSGQEKICQSALTEKVPLVLIGEPPVGLQLGVPSRCLCLPKLADARQWRELIGPLKGLGEALSAVEAELKAKEKGFKTLMHDMRSPLTALSLEIGMIGRWWEKREDEKFHKSLSRIRKTSAELSEMIENLDDLQKLRAGELDIQLSEVSCIDWLQNVCAKTGEKLQLCFDFQNHSTTSLNGDSRLLERALVLFIRYWERVRTSAAPITLAGRWIDEKMLCLSISDPNDAFMDLPLELLNWKNPLSINGSTVESRWLLALELGEGIFCAHGGNIRVKKTAENKVSGIEILLPTL